MTSMLHNLQIKSFLLQFSFFFEGKIYIQLLNIDKSFAASAFFKEIIGLISYERNIIFFVCQLFLRKFFVPACPLSLSHSAEFLKKTLGQSKFTPTFENYCKGTISKFSSTYIVHTAKYIIPRNYGTASPCHNFFTYQF